MNGWLKAEEGYDSTDTASCDENSKLDSELKSIFQETKTDSPDDSDGDSDDQTHYKHYKLGVCIAMCMTLCTASSAACAQALAGFIPEFELNLIRFSVLLLLVIPVILVKQLSIKVSRPYIPWLGITCLMYNAYNVFYYGAAIYLPLSAVGGISRSFMLIIVAVLTLFTSKECSFPIVISVVLCITGMVLIAQPQFMFHNILPEAELTAPRYQSVCLQGSGSVNDISNTSDTSVPPLASNPQITSDVPDTNNALGYTFLFISSFAASIIYFVVNRKLRDVAGLVVTFWVAVWGIIVSLLLALIFEDFTSPSNIECVLLVLGHSLGAGLGTAGNLIAVQMISPVILTLVGSLQVVILCIAQYTVMADILPGKRNAAEIVGVGTTFIGNITFPVYTICLNWYKNRK